MNYLYTEISKGLNFYGNTNPVEFAEKYGIPLYVHSEDLMYNFV